MAFLFSLRQILECFLVYVAVYIPVYNAGMKCHLQEQMLFSKDVYYIFLLHYMVTLLTTVYLAII